MNFLNKIKNFFIQKKYLFGSFGVLTVFLLAMLVLWPQTALADVVNGLGSIMGTLLSGLFESFVYIMGNLLIKAIEILIQVASYTDFINSPIVNKGWVVIRDVCNIAITIVLLLMAFYTVLRAKSYQYQTLLPKLLLAAILINFSKTIAGLCIDLAQVFMMTFVNAFREAAAGNLTYGFGINDIVSIRDTAGGGVGAGAGLQANVDNWSVLGALALGALMVLVAFLVVISLVAMLLWRILFLWFLVMLSPIAFMAGVLPGEGESKVKEWWSTFIKYLIQGPIIAFMLWLSLAVISEMTEQKHIVALQFKSAVSQGNVQASNPAWQAFANKASGTQNLVDYLVTCGLLLLTLKIASQSGVAGASVAGNAFGKLQNYGNQIVKRGQRIATSPLRGAKRVGGAAFKATRIPYMASAFATKIKTSGVGRALGGDKEYTEELNAGRKAWADEKIGGKKGTLASFRYQQAQKARKRLEDQGRLAGGEDSQRKLLNDSIAAGNLVDAQGIMLQMAKDGKLGSDDVDKYKKALKIKPGSGEEKLYMEFAETLKNSQKASGDLMADYKFDVTRDSQGRLRPIVDRVQQVHDDFSKKKSADFNNAGLIKAFDEEKPEFLAILDELNKKDDMNSLGNDGRASYRKIVEQVLAREADGSLKLTVEQKSTYEALLKKLYARRFDRTTGEALTSASTRFGGLPKDVQDAILEGESEYDGNMGTTARAGFLGGISTKFKDKQAEKKRQAMMYNQEAVSDIDSAVDNEVIEPMVYDGITQALLYQTTSQDRGSAIGTSGAGYIRNLKANLDTLDRNFQSQAVARGVSNIINPNTSRAFTYLELYHKSALLKNIQDLTGIANSFSPVAFRKMSKDEQEKFMRNIENRLDVLRLGAERAFTNSPAEPLAQRVKRKKVENRTTLQDNLGQVINHANTMATSSLTPEQRNKALKALKNHLDRAVKHSKKYNDDQFFKAGLDNLRTDADALDVANAAQINSYVARVNVLYNQVKAK